MSKPKQLTWDDLAELYDKRTGGRARTRPMDAVFEWATQQPDIEQTDDGGLVMKKPKVSKNCYIIWQDGYLACTIDHNKPQLCVLNQGEHHDL